MKKLIFTVFFIIERWVFKGIPRKNKKVKTVFASILIPKCVFSKTKMQNILNHRVQFITKIMIFRKIKTSCNTKTLWKQFRKKWNFRCFNQKYTYNATSESLIKPIKITKNHGNEQNGGPFGHCVRCVFVVNLILHEFEDSPSALRINPSWQTISKNKKKDKIKHEKNLKTWFSKNLC